MPRTPKKKVAPRTMPLTYHKNAEGEFVCPTCGVIKARQNSMHYHMKKHQEELDHPCAYCTKSFLQKQTLMLHLQSKHADRLEQTNTKPFSCPFDGCTFASHTKGNCVIHCLRVHVQELVQPLLRYHTESRHLSCTQCHTRFHSASAFYYHVKGCIRMDKSSDAYRRLMPLL